MKVTKMLLLLSAVTISALAGETAVAPFTDLERAGELIGKVVINAKGVRVGKVGDFAVDLSSGRVAEVLVNTRGFLTSSARTVAVPPQVFAVDTAGNDLRMSGDLDAFEGAPVFDISIWSQSTANASVDDLYKRFHVNAATGFKELAPASKIIGMVAKNRLGQRVSKIEDLVVDVPSGRIPDVLMTSGAMGELMAVSPRAFVYSAEYHSLLLDATRPDLKKAPHFKASDWRSAVDNPFKVAAVNLTSSDGSSSPAQSAQDDALTAEIEHKILMAPDLSSDAHRVEVRTEQGKVTLRGTVDSESEKQKVVEIAVSVVPADHVINHLIVRVFAVR